MKNHTSYILPMLCLLFISCNGPKKEPTLSENELRSLALEQGNMISENTQKVLGSTLKEVVQNEGIPQALKYCNVRAYPIVDSLENVYQANIRRASHRTRNPDDAPDKAEAQIIEEYLINIQNGETPAVKVVIGKEDVHFYKPIILSASLCLNCHGKVGTDINEENHQIIQALYTDDEAIGHEMGDLRGIWSISFKKDAFRKNRD
jgi:hypothetical protein